MFARLFCLVIPAGAAAFCAAVDFEKEIRPVLEKNCVGCHNEEMRMGSLRLDTREAAMAGGRRGQGVIPGEPERSRIYEMISGDKPKMPPSGALPAETVALIRRWIAEGARWVDKPAARRKWEVDARMAGLRRQMREGRFANVRAAVEADPALAKARDGEGNTLLHGAALYGRTADLEWLLAKGADAGAGNGSRVTALHLSARDAGKVRALLAAGAQAGAESADGRTPLQIAVAMKGTREVVELLLAAGAKPAPAHVRAAMAMCEPRSAETLKQALAGGDGAAEAERFAGNIGLCRIGPPPTGRARQFMERAELLTPETHAGLELLLTTGDVNLKMGDDVTPLMLAVYADPVNEALIKKFIAAGADLNAKSKNGDTALSLARRKGAEAIEKLLVAAGAKQ